MPPTANVMTFAQIATTPRIVFFFFKKPPPADRNPPLRQITTETIHLSRPQLETA